MTDATGKYFGLVIAYVLPGFAALWTLRPYSPTIRSWMDMSATLPAGLESVFFVTLASTAAGMAISALRWAAIDSMFALSGVRRPSWNDAHLQENILAWEVVVEAHYRYFQFYAHMAIVLPFTAVALPMPSALIALLVLVFECLFLAAARDALAKYYARASRLLGTVSISKDPSHDQRQPQESSRERRK
ncbi:MAG: hypothetical protein J0M17_11075 [Planctomycetes bacterium]|nr:hypothetical protein [Planctomycetota bacterium]